ncbi:hypothetical protein N9W44_02595 [Alphaproteobacteria bacterium]|nr:hypothetical protein [Alphaproteobacteria bacterium]
MFSYLSPLIVPLFGEPNSVIEIELDLTKILQSRGIDGASGKFKVECATFTSRKKIDNKVHEFSADSILTAPKREALSIKSFADQCGYLEISFQSEAPIFRRLDLSVGYSIYTRDEVDTFTVIPDTKFARPILIDQFRETGQFSLVHSASFSQNNQGTGNSLFFVNPYKKAVLVRIQSQSGKKISAKIDVNEAKMLSLDDFLEDGEVNCVQLTANNRIPAWDVKHSSRLPRRINNIDHLDVFRGTRTKQETTPLRYAKDKLRDFLQFRSVTR